jgi:hypothetical protein
MHEKLYVAMILCDIAYCMKEEIICHYVYTRHCFVYEGGNYMLLDDI